MSAHPLSRRDWLRLSAAGVLGPSVSGWFESLAAVAPPARKKSCVLLWMSGGPSSIDLFDLKPGHANGGPFEEIATNAAGVRIGEHLPKLAKLADGMALVRSMSTGEGDHSRATHLLRTGYAPSNAVAYPTLGSLASKELGDVGSPLPNFVSIAPYRSFGAAAFSPGFLGPMHAPLIVGENAPPDAGYEKALEVEDLEPAGGVSAAEHERRVGLVGELNREFGAGRPDTPATSHASAVARAVRLMRSPAGKAFDLKAEKAGTRDAYGRNLFGQGCLLARRLVEQGVPFVEVTLDGWDTHEKNFEKVASLSAVLDAGWSALTNDLKERGLLGNTLIVWMGEFGRTPKVNRNAGRDHFPRAWATVLAGGGVKGGQAYGKTSKDGTTVESSPVTVPDFMATVVKALGIDPTKQNQANGRPIRIVEKGGTPIDDLVG